MSKWVFAFQNLVRWSSNKKAPSNSSFDHEATSVDTVFKKPYFSGSGIILVGFMGKQDYIYTNLWLWRKWIEFLKSYALLKLWLLPYFPNDVYPCGHHKGLLFHFNNQICKFPLSIKSKQSSLKVIDFPVCASKSIKPYVLPLPLPRVSIFLWSIVKSVQRSITNV